MPEITITLSYDGVDASNHQLDFYDAATALLGFQRSLAIVTHLTLNGEIITQAPSLKGARIFVHPPKAGSWEIAAFLVLAGTALYKVGTTPKDTPIGHIVRSVYDLVISSALGFHVDYEKSLGQQYEEYNISENALPRVRLSQIQSAAEKCETAIKDMHRPIVISETADTAKIFTSLSDVRQEMSVTLSQYSYERLMENSV